MTKKRAGLRERHLQSYNAKAALGDTIEMILYTVVGAFRDGGGENEDEKNDWEESLRHKVLTLINQGIPSIKINEVVIDIIDMAETMKAEEDEYDKAAEIYTTAIAAAYATLNIPPDSGVQTIKSAYKTKAKEYHPDRNHDPEAAGIVNDKCERSSVNNIPVSRSQTRSCWTITSPCQPGTIHLSNPRMETRISCVQSIQQSLKNVQWYAELAAYEAWIETHGPTERFPLHNPARRTACATLGIPVTSDATAIKCAYRAKVRQWHPDLHPDDPEAAEKFRAIQKAYDTLMTKGEGATNQ